MIPPQFSCWSCCPCAGHPHPVGCGQEAEGRGQACLSSGVSPESLGGREVGWGGVGRGADFPWKLRALVEFQQSPSSASRNPGACAEEQLPVGLAGQAGLVPGHGGGAACITATWRELAWIRSWGGAQVFLILTRYLLLKVWALCQQHRQHLGAC